MSDEEKIKWFNKSVEWVEGNGGIEAVTDMADTSSDIAYDLFFDFLNQCKKIEDTK